MPKVSFVLPAYKRRFLQEAIASILAQTYGDFELVVVDDHSPENLKEIVDRFADPRLTYRFNAENLGRRDLVAAWEHAMTFARGEWCVLASDDDLYHPDYLAEMMALARKYPTASLLHSRLARIDAEGRWLRLAPVRREFERTLEMVYSRAVLRYEQVMPDFVFRLADYRAIGGFVKFPAAWYTDDATWMTLAKFGGVAYSDRVLFFFRFSGQSISSSNAFVIEKLTAGKRFLDWCLCYVGSLAPANDEERFMKESILSSVQGKVFAVIAHLCSLLPMGAFVRTIRLSEIPRDWKKTLVKDRVKRMCSVRQWLKGIGR